MDEYDWAVQECKGWLEVTVVRDGGSRQLVEVYYPARLAQAVADELARTVASRPGTCWWSRV
ncbi:hypothetical protein [Kitasatospora sp. NPDC048407]|uniref:hypothetical protein n=1 Tax=Kitasatospora sp. NPDC048407 TaxID=3364051 RepID=UPI00371552B9